MSHAINRVVPSLSRFALEDKNGVRTGDYPTPQEAEQSSMFQSIMSGKPTEQLAPERPPFRPELNFGADRLRQGSQMPGLSQYQFAGMSPNPRDAQNPRNPALANHTMSAQDNAGLDEMLKNLDSGQAAPSNLSQARQTMGPGTGQQGNPWMQWLQQFVQQFGQGGAPGAPPQR